MSLQNSKFQTYHTVFEYHLYHPDVESTVDYTLDEQHTLQHYLQRSDLGLGHDQSREQEERRGSFPRRIDP